MTRTTRLGLLCAAATLGSAAPAAADPTFTETLVTPTAMKPGTRVILYYLRMQSGPQEERFSMRLTPPRFATLGGRDEGQTVDGPRAIALQGPGRIGQQDQAGDFAPACSASKDRQHGYTTGADTVDLLLPPNSGTTLAVRYETGAFTPWADSDFRLTFTALPRLVGTYAPTDPFAVGATLQRSVTLRTAGPTAGGPIAAHLVLTSVPAGAYGSATSARTVARRTAIVARGRLLPAAGGRQVILEASRNGGMLRTVARVRTDRSGAFRAPAWRPALAGTYELWARYPTQPGGLRADTTSCPLRFRVR